MRTKVVVAIAFVLLLAGCGGGGKQQMTTTTSPVKRVSVVATTTQIGDLARSVAGRYADVRVIVPIGKPVTTYKPSADDVTTLANADVILRNGVGLDPWLDGALDSDSAAVTTDVSDGVQVLNRTIQGKQQKDPYIWMSPVNARIMVANIVKALSEHDPTHASAYNDSQRAYSAQIDAAQRSSEQVLSALVDKKLVTSANTMGYYASEFDIDYVGSVDTIAADQLANAMKAQRVQNILCDSVYTTGPAQAVATPAGASLVVGSDVLYGESLGPKGSGADTYIGMLEHDTDVMVAHLG